MPTAGNYAGDYEPQGAIVINSSQTAAIQTKGNVCVLSSGDWVKATAAAGHTGPFAVATKTSTAADTTNQYIVRGIVYVLAEGAITVNNLVQCSATTAGSVMAYAASTIASTTPTGTQVIAGAADFSRVVGIYLGHENEGDGFTVPTDAADGDTIRILLGGI
jgi:hypothetical protein